jgi:MFS family permease
VSTFTDPANRRSAFRFIVCLGIVSLFADMTYEGAYSIIGPFLKELNATAAALGFVSGMGEMIGASMRYFTGRLADRTRAYWTLTIAGYVLNLIAIPALAFVGTWQAAAIFVATERLGKAMRGPARDVLLSEATEVVGHGSGFGLHAAMDQTGAVIGPLFVAYSVSRAHGYSRAFLALAIPAVLALLALFAARAARRVPATPPKTKPSQALPPVFWTYTLAAGLLACGYVDFTLLAYHFQKTGEFSDAWIPILYSVAMGVNGLTAFLYGRLFDRIGIVVLAVGTLISLLALPFGFLGGVTGGVVAVVCWAAGLGCQDASLRSSIAQVVSMNKRGTAFGSFNLVFGVLWFAGSWTMGALYDHSLVAVVTFGVAFQLVAAAMFFALRRPLAVAAAAAA